MPGTPGISPLHPHSHLDPDMLALCHGVQPLAAAPSLVPDGECATQSGAVGQVSAS